jgi:hypothetical protein
VAVGTGVIGRSWAQVVNGAGCRTRLYDPEHIEMKQAVFAELDRCCRSGCDTGNQHLRPRHERDCRRPGRGGAMHRSHNWKRFDLNALVDSQIVVFGQRGNGNSVELERYPLFGVRRRLSHDSDDAITPGAELPTLVVKIRRREYQRASGSDQPP